MDLWHADLTTAQRTAFGAHCDRMREDAVQLILHGPVERRETAIATAAVYESLKYDVATPLRQEREEEQRAQRRSATGLRPTG